MKGQFLLISSIVIGVILITTASTINRIQAKEFSSDLEAYDVDALREEAQKVSMADAKERENFHRLVNMLEPYKTESSFWGSQTCFNVTLRKSDARLRVKCIP